MLWIAPFIWITLDWSWEIRDIGGEVTYRIGDIDNQKNEEEGRAEQGVLFVFLKGGQSGVYFPASSNLKINVDYML